MQWRFYPRGVCSLYPNDPLCYANPIKVGEAIVSVNFPNSNLDDPALARTAYGLTQKRRVPVRDLSATNLTPVLL